MHNRPVGNFILITGAAFLLCYEAFSNHYPLTTSDTGTYIYSGFMGKVPDDRPILYGLFIRHISLAESLFFVVIMQGILLAYLLFLCFKYFVNIPYKPIWYVLLITLLTLFTGASLNVSQLTADIFTPLMILSLGLLVSSCLGFKENLLVAIIFMFALSTHFSHMAICFLILCFFTLSMFFFNKENRLKGRTLTKVWLLFLAASFMVPAVHYLYNGHFRASNSKHVFFMAKLHEMGILESYLNKECRKHDFKMCVYKNKLPEDFLGDANSPVYKTGGWDVNKAEYNFIIHDVLTTPSYLKKGIEKAASHSVSQFFTFSVGVPPKADSTSAPYGVVKWFFPEDMPQFTSCAQNEGRLNYSFLNTCQLLLVVFSMSFLFLLFSLNFQGISIVLKQAGLIILSGIGANAIVCGSLAIVTDRLQARVIWLLPVFAFLLLLNQWEFIKTRAVANFRSPH